MVIVVIDNHYSLLRQIWARLLTGNRLGWIFVRLDDFDYITMVSAWVGFSLRWVFYTSDTEEIKGIAIGLLGPHRARLDLPGIEIGVHSLACIAVFQYALHDLRLILSLFTFLLANIPLDIVLFLVHAVELLFCPSKSLLHDFSSTNLVIASLFPCVAFAVQSLLFQLHLSGVLCPDRFELDLFSRFEFESGPVIQPKLNCLTSVLNPH